MGDRIWKISTHPYDQVIALTQHTINQALDNLYLSLPDGEEDDGAVGLKPSAASANQDNWIEDVEFGPPAVVVSTEGRNSSIVRFRMHLRSGRIRLSRPHPEAECRNGIPSVFEMLEMVIEDWHVTVSMNIKPTEVDRSNSRGKAIEQRSAAKKNSNHSIQELRLDLSSMSFANAVWDIGTWGLNDCWILYEKSGNRHRGPCRPQGWEAGKPRRFEVLCPEFQSAAKSLVRSIAADLEKANLTSMGFSVIANDPNNRATFEVNHSRYMSYPWTDPRNGKVAQQGLDGNGRLNYLLFLQTVGGNQPPDQSSPEAILNPRMGNWTEGRTPGKDDPTTFGTFMLSSGNFIERFVLPKLSAINRMMTVHISNVWAFLDTGFPWLAYNFAVGSTLEMGGGDTAKDQTTFNMRQQEYQWGKAWPQAGRDHFADIRKSPGKGASIWRYQKIQSGDDGGYRICKKTDDRMQIWMYGDAITFTRLYTLAGSNEIVYEGAQWTKFEYWIEPGRFLSNKNAKIAVKSTWKITFTMQEVTDGGLHINIDYVRPDPVFISNSHDDEFGKLGALQDQLIEMSRSAGENFEHFVESIRNCLEHQEKFVLPASGVFYFKNPLMNHKGDLVANLEYNGNPTRGSAINPTTSNVRMRTGNWAYNSFPLKAEFKHEGDGKKGDED
ncbi:hypothetical protein QBC45DRAFT_423868 [Copromyces sp. CBS 386.78]|nr:hypothetical protein QBC45DRAFT_423868 [Copromyces sp. CBS 386.78]